MTEQELCAVLLSEGQIAAPTLEPFPLSVGVEAAGDCRLTWFQLSRTEEASADFEDVNCSTPSHTDVLRCGFRAQNVDQL